MSLRVLVRDEPDAPIDVLSAVDGVEVMRWTDAEHLPEGADEVEVLVTNATVADVDQLLPQLPRLKLMQTLSAGVEQIEDHVPEGVLLSNARGAHGGSTAEWAMAALLAVLRELPTFVRRQDEGRWDQHMTDTLAGKRVLVLGAGDLAQEFRRRAEAFDAAVELVGRRAREGVHGMDELPTLLPQTDALLVVLPLSDSTRGIVDAELLARLPDGAVFVNAGRGPLVDTDALLAELTAERLRAALDVTDPEPLPEDHALWSAPNVLVTPHVAGSTVGYEQRAWQVAAEQIAQFAAGQDPDNRQG